MGRSRALRLAGAGRAACRPGPMGARCRVLLRLRRADAARARCRRDAGPDRRCRRSPCRSPTRQGTPRWPPAPRRCRSCARWPHEVLELPAADEHYAPAARSALHAARTGSVRPRAPARSRRRRGPAGGRRRARGGRADRGPRAGAHAGRGRPGGDRRRPSLAARPRRACWSVCWPNTGCPAAWGGETAFAHTPLGHALRGAARCALAGVRASRRPRTCWPTCARRAG